jgi:hypothetical protein
MREREKKKEKNLKSKQKTTSKSTKHTMRIPKRRNQVTSSNLGPKPITKSMKQVVQSSSMAINCNLPSPFWQIPMSTLLLLNLPS